MLVVDVGNTRLHFSFVQKGKFRKRFFLNTQITTYQDIERVLALYRHDDVIVCSVVPAVTDFFRALKKCWRQKKIYNKSIEGAVYIVGEDIAVPMKCFYNFRQIGMDRLVAAFAARALYPRTRMVIDFGTAITVDVLSPKGDYRGGFILPGIGSSLKAFSSCALLPKTITLKRIQKVIPTNTEESISRGVEEGFSCMLNTFVAHYKKVLHLSFRDAIVVTGGEATFIIPRLKFVYQYEPLLVEKGLAILGENR